MRELLSATVEGLGSGEVPVFPIQIFKVKDGISYTDEDYAAAMADFEGAMAEKSIQGAQFRPVARSLSHDFYFALPQLPLFRYRIQQKRPLESR